MAMFSYNSDLMSLNLGEDSMENLELLMRFLSYSIFAVVGYLFSRRLSPPKGAFSWVLIVLLVLVIFLSDYMMGSARLVGVGPTGIYLNNSVQGLGIGILCGFAMKGTASIVRA